jgi:hypothetical protein
MFWDFDFNQSSNIDAVLDAEGCTLESVLDEDDVLQECKGANDKLITFFFCEEIMKKLVDYVV